ncbi:MAG: hypothetical protein H0T89_18120 [Deltaproteobacteria bacterium]|nr:hypothetical protein [Deltaproteobacteria bacterium]MDQ3299824.1 hypothetical protein [Myxococcota bacterium]
MRRVRSGIAALFLASTGCLDALGPELGPEIMACTPEDSDPERSISFRTDVLDGLLTRKCARCHTPEAPNPIGISMGGLDLSGYATLRAGGVTSGDDVVVDGDPCRSVLSQKLGAAPPFGARMPRGGPFLEQAEQQVIADWIVEGARDN